MGNMLMNNQTAKEVISFLEEYTQYYRDLVFFLLEKYNKILEDDLAWMLESLPEEQALVMKGTAFETKRLQYFKAKGLEGYTATMLVENSPEEYRRKMQVTCEEFNKLILEVQRINRETTENVEKKLSTQQELVEKAGLLNRPQTYNVAGNKISTTTDFTVIGDV